jgi:hypothetical protein
LGVKATLLLEKTRWLKSGEGWNQPTVVSAPGMIAPVAGPRPRN